MRYHQEEISIDFTSILLDNSLKWSKRERQCGSLILTVFLGQVEI